MSPVLEYANVSRSFKRVPVLNDVSFSIGEGEVLGLIGRNGAGKTTLINIAIGLLYPGVGEVRVFGLSPTNSPMAVKERIGYEDWHVVVEWTAEDVHDRLTRSVGHNGIRCVRVPLEELFIELVGGSRQKEGA